MVAVIHILTFASRSLGCVGGVVVGVGGVGGVVVIIICTTHCCQPRKSILFNSLLNRGFFSLQCFENIFSFGCHDAGALSALF